MPAPSTAMQQAAAIAKHHPGKLYKRNRGLLKMSAEDLDEFARTSHEGLPRRVPTGKRKLADLMSVRRRKSGRS